MNTDKLQRLVLQDLELSDKAQQNIIDFIEKANKLENLQLVNCQLFPEYMIRICTELESQL